MSDQYKCTKCGSMNTYQDAHLWVCLECMNEWDASAVGESSVESAVDKVVDANGNELQDGDSVVLVKDLKVKGGASLKVGTKAKNIRLIESDNGHNIDCKIDGVGSIYLKSEFVKKV